MTYRTWQQQVNDTLAWGISLMFVGLMFGLMRLLITKTVEPEKETPRLLPQVLIEGGEPIPVEFLGW